MRPARSVSSKNTPKALPAATALFRHRRAKHPPGPTDGALPRESPKQARAPQGRSPEVYFSARPAEAPRARCGCGAVSPGNQRPSNLQLPKRLGVKVAASYTPQIRTRCLGSRALGIDLFTRSPTPTRASLGGRPSADFTPSARSGRRRFFLSGPALQRLLVAFADQIFLAERIAQRIVAFFAKAVVQMPTPPFRVAEPARHLSQRAAEFLHRPHVIVHPLRSIEEPTLTGVALER